MLKRFFLVTIGLLLCVSWVTIQLPEVRDARCEAALNAPYIPGHDVLVLSKSDDSVVWKKELINHANHSIEFSTGFTGGPLLEEMLLLLDNALTLKPELVVHCFISSCPLFGWADERKVELLAERYPDRFYYLVRGMAPLRRGFGLVTSENHVKLLVVDEKYVVIGGTNLLHGHARSEVPPDVTIEGVSDFFNPKACIDMDFVVKGPVAHSLRKEFFDLWALYESGASLKEESQFEAEETRYFAEDNGRDTYCRAFEDHPDTVHDVPVKTLVSGPRRSPGACTAEYAALVDSARQSVDLMHMYITPVDELFNSLIDASNRGVAIELVTNGADSPASIVSKVYGTCNRAHMLPLLLGRKFRLGERDLAEKYQDNKCSIYAYEVEETLYHKKVMVIDDRISVIGSYNLGHKSHYGDYEVILEVDSPQVAKNVKRVMERDKVIAKPCERFQLMDWYFGLGSRSLALLEGTLIVGPLY